MVLLEFKKSTNNVFLTELPSHMKIEEVLKHLVILNNLRVKIDKLVDLMEGLCNHGPLRPEALRGLTQPETYNPAFEMLTQDEKEFMTLPLTPNQILRPDPSGYRTGHALNDQSNKNFLDTIAQAKKIISAQNAEMKKQFDIKEAEEMILLLKGTVMIAFPGYYALPAWDPVYLILENKFNFLQHYPDCDWLEEPHSTLWWAKKELLNGKTLADYVGKNEKTKIVVKIMPKGKGAPVGEPPIDQETHKKMLAYYYKKQEEAKKLEEENEDDYLNSEWANPNQLKSHLINGGKSINMRPFR